MMVASGFAGLGYQIVWTQQSALWLGNESAAVLAVVAAFFGGLALGALVLTPRIDRSPSPGRWYAACEAALGSWSLALVFLLPPFTGALLDIIGPQPSPAWHWAVAFCGTFLLLLPATAAMGATLPAIERVLAHVRREGTSIAVLYAGNTFGAVLGVLAAAFVLVPAYGLTMTAGVCAALNFACAVAAAKLFAGPASRASPAKLFAEAATDAAAIVQPDWARPDSTRALALLAATGLLGIGYEVLVVRVLSQVAQNTVYTFAILLAVYLVGTALGAAAYGRWLSLRASRASERMPGTDARVRDRLLQMLAAACLLGMLSLAHAQALQALIVAALPAGIAAALAAEAAVAVAAFLPATIAMGALFSHLGTNAGAAGVGFGRALGFNTLGAAAAPVLFGVLLAPLLGSKLALALVAAGYLALVSRRAWSAPPQWVAAGVAAALAAWAPSLAIVDVPDGGKLVSYRDGVLAAVSIVEDANGVASLHIDNRQQEGSSATLQADARQALLPILLHPSPRRALFLGLGTGVTASWAAEDPLLEVDAVELVPEVIAASGYFTRSISGNKPNPRLHLLRADARRFVRAARERYDVIVADNFHPARSGSGSLYTVEHFAAVRERLAADGVFCQWLPLHQLDLDTLRTVVRSFLAVYPYSFALLATNSLETPVVGLVARNGDLGFSLERVRARLAGAAMPHGPAELGVPDDLALLGTFIGGPEALARFAGGAALNTDDHPVVAYGAPWITYHPDSLPRDRLIALLREVEISPAELHAASGAAWDARLAAYWAARNRFIEAGRDVQPTSDVRRMLTQVREPLLSVLRVSPDFRPAYDPLLLMATALAQIDTGAASALLIELERAQPARPEAAQALRHLGGNAP